MAQRNGHVDGLSISKPPASGPAGLQQPQDYHYHANGNGQKPPILPPHSQMAEEALIGALLIDPDMILEVDYLGSADFYVWRHGLIYQVIKDLADRNLPVDLISITTELEKRDQLADLGGPATLSDYIANTIYSSHASYYARIIYRHSIQRKIIEASARLVKYVHENGEDEPEVILAQCVDVLSSIDAEQVTAGPQTSGAAAGRFLDKIETLQSTSKIAGLTFGLRDLDRLFGGMDKGKLYILAGRPGMGKSGIALTCALNLARQGKRVLFFSLEMPEMDVTGRLISQLSGIAFDRLFSGQIQDDQWPAVLQSAAAVDKLSLWIDDQALLSMPILKARAKRQQARQGLDLIIIDHLGMARSGQNNKNRYEEASLIADEAVALAKDLDVPVLGLLQLSREVEGRVNKRPMLSDLRDSGKWEENAHGILFVYRDSYYNQTTDLPNVAEIIAAKNRGGRTGPVSVFWRKDQMRFEDLTVRKEDWIA